MRVLADLLRPIGLDTFFTKFWERAPLHRPGTPLAITGQEIEKLVRAVGGQSNAIIDSVNFAEDRRRLDPSPSALILEERAGRTVIVNGAHHVWAPLGELAAALTVELRSPVRANLYLTPAHGVGFPVHADLHDVFILQLKGTKHWLLYPPALPLASPPPAPVVEEHRRLLSPDAGPRNEQPVQALTTAPGDLLYLPRGMRHMAAAGPEYSIHATVGVHTPTWATLLSRALAAAAMDDVELRRSPRPDAPPNPAEFRRALEKFTQRADLAAALASLAEQPPS